METKKPWQSKTMILNAVGGLLAAVALFWPGATDLQLWINAHGTQIGMVWGILNMILRAITKDQIGLGD